MTKRTVRLFREQEYPTAVWYHAGRDEARNRELPLTNVYLQRAAFGETMPEAVTITVEETPAE